MWQAHKQRARRLLAEPITFEEKGGVSVAQQLRDALAKKKGRAYGILDYLREFDLNQDLRISREEFRRTVTLLGYAVSRADADATFAAFDHDGSGDVSVRELGKALRRDVKAEKQRRELILAAADAHEDVLEQQSLREEVARSYREACAAARILLVGR